MYALHRFLLAQELRSCHQCVERVCDGYARNVARIRFCAGHELVDVFTNSSSARQERTGFIGKRDQSAMGLASTSTCRQGRLYRKQRSQGACAQWTRLQESQRAFRVERSRGGPKRGQHRMFIFSIAGSRLIDWVSLTVPTHCLW